MAVKQNKDRVCSRGYYLPTQTDEASKDGTVWCEVEYSDDIDYQKEADRNGIHPNGRFVERDAYLKHVPTNGFYRYKTSPQMYGRWIIAGKMKIVRILTDREVCDICSRYGLTPLQRYIS